MKWSVTRAHWCKLALVVVVSVACGCQTAPRPAREKAAPPEIAATLSPAAAQRLEAIAAYATGVSKLAEGIDAALPWYERALELDPHNVAHGVELAKLFILGRKQYDRAITLLQTLIVNNPRVGEPHFWLGLAYKSAGKTDLAPAEFRRALKLDPAYLNATQALLETVLEENNLDEAARLLTRAAQQQVNDSEYWMHLGDLYTTATKQKPALASRLDAQRARLCYEKAAALDPDDPDILARLASVYESAGDKAKSAELYQRLAAVRPEDVAVHVKLAEAYLQADEKEKAAHELEQIIKLEPLRFIPAYNELAGLYEELNDDDKAVATYQQSLAVNPSQLQPYLRMALIQMHHKRFDLAQQALDTAHEKWPTSYEVAYFQGLLCSEQKQYSKAVTAFADAETFASHAPEPVKLEGTFYFYYGSVCERTGDIDRAARLFQKAIALDPNNHAAYNYLGYMWAEKGIHLAEAQQHIQKALALSPDNAAYVDSLGWVLHRLGKDQEALVQLQHAVELIKDDPTVLEHLADVLIVLNRAREAVPHLERAHQLDPANKAISDKLQKLKGSSSSAQSARPATP